jgi:hypothetical protein
MWTGARHYGGNLSERRNVLNPECDGDRRIKLPIDSCTSPLHGCQRNCGGSRLGTKVATLNFDDEVLEWGAQNVAGAAADVIEYSSTRRHTLRQIYSKYAIMDVDMGNARCRYSKTSL